MPTHETEKMAVVVPAYNEPSIGRTLRGLYEQAQRPDEIHHFVVDNASTDDTRARVQEFMNSHDDFPLTVLSEEKKGTGAAADTGFRAAIDAGYDIIARTDADTVPTPLWTSRISDRFHSGHNNLQLLGGKSSPLTMNTTASVITPSYPLPSVCRVMWLLSETSTRDI